MKYKGGEVVVAQRVILDRDQHGDWYIHAVPGTFGVVNDFGQTEPSVDVTWEDGSQCTVHEDEVMLYLGDVSRVVD
jgi:hypothetical protein